MNWIPQKVPIGRLASVSRSFLLLESFHEMGIHSIFQANLQNRSNAFNDPYGEQINPD